MGFTIGMPSLKLNNVGNKSKHCGSFKKVAEEALKERLGLDLDINPELAAENIYIGFTTAEELIAYSAQHIQEINEWRAENGKRPYDRRKLKSDTVVMCSTIIKPPIEMMEQLSREEQERFLRDAYDSFLEIIGAENAKAAVMHFDELSPHIHIFWEPMVDEHRICAKEKHNLKYFGTLNREMPQMLRDKGWDVDDCQAYDKAEEDKKREEMGEVKYREYRKEQKAKRKTQGKDSHTFKHEAKQAVQQLQEQQAALQRDVQQLEERKSELQEQTAAEQQKLEQAKRDTVTAIEKPPRPTLPEAPTEPSKPIYSNKEYWDEYKKALKEYKAAKKQYDRELPKAQAAQAEWDKNYNLIQIVQEVQEQQEQTAARQALIAQQQSQTAKKQQEQAAALIAAQKSIPQKIAEGVREQLSRSERLAQLMQATESWKRRYEQMFNKPYTDTPQERTDLDASKPHKTKQDIHRWTR